MVGAIARQVLDTIYNKMVVSGGTVKGVECSGF